jgi:diphthamide biosynthesis protein 7
VSSELVDETRYPHKAYSKPTSFPRKIIQTQREDSAILDFHFQQLSGKQNTCGAVSSTSIMCIYDFSPDHDPSSPLTRIAVVRLPGIGEDVLFLSFCWHPTIEDVVALTTSTGQVRLVRFEQNYETLSASTAIMTHSLEAWCVAISPTLSLSGDGLPQDTSLTLLSGGDDSNLHYVDCTLGEPTAERDGDLALEDISAQVSVKGHGAGVTAILPLWFQSRHSTGLFVTGSYEDRIRLFRLPTTHNPGTCGRSELLAECNLGGGVWRIKLIHLDERENYGKEDTQSRPFAWRARLLVSCMYAGVRVLELVKSVGGGYDFSVLARFEEHQSMNYGSDFRMGPGPQLQCVSTSFYDKLVCLWEPNLP